MALVRETGHRRNSLSVARCAGGLFLAIARQLMSDPVEEVVAPAAIERVIGIYQQLQQHDQSVLLQARKILTQHIFGMVDQGECNEQRLTVGGLARLKAVERDHAIASAQGACRKRRKRRVIA